MKGSICYILQEHKDSPLYLCVMDQERQQYHRFPITVANASRLAQECSGAVHAAISGFSHKHAYQEVAALLSKKFGEK